jgi:hypothetical protein
MRCIWKIDKVQVKNRATHRQKVSVRVKQVLYVMMGGKTQRCLTRNATHTRLLENAGPQFHCLPDAESMDYFSLFFNDKLLNNIVVETNMYETQNFRTSA